LEKYKTQVPTTIPLSADEQIKLFQIAVGTQAFPQNWFGPLQEDRANQIIPSTTTNLSESPLIISISSETTPPYFIRFACCFTKSKNKYSHYY